MSQYKHFRISFDQNNICWLTFDKEGEKVNSMDQDVLTELQLVLNNVKGKKPKGLVIESGKSSGFIAGADLKKISNINDPSLFKSFIEQGHNVFNLLADLSVPTVALIDGFCLGGGTELVLACDYRICSPRTVVGLPEVKLGIQPGWGGSVRAARLTGDLTALDLMLTGRAVKAKPAKKIGLIDHVSEKRNLYRAATSYVLKKPKKKAAAWYNSIFKLQPIRSIIANYMIKPKISAKAKKEHYPAPFAIIDNWVDAGIHGNHAFTSEIESICKLAVTETAKNLLRVFFLTEKLKNQQYNSEPKDIKHVHVLGAGVMGGDIAAVSAMRGFKVTLQDLDKKQIGATISRARKLFSKKLKKQHLINDALDRLIPDPEGIGVKKADLIIEAIVENLSVKQEVFVELEKNAKPSAILATNTSTIPLDQIASKLKDQSRLVGIHFFNPVAQMMLVEVIHFEQSSMQSIESAIKFVRRLDKLPIRVKSSPGFLVNRVLLPYLSEAMLMLEEGIAKEDIDKVAKDFGMPMGPIELADTVGLDVCVFAQESLAKYLDNVTEIPRTVRQMLDHKKLGRKTGEGFYKYSKGKIVNKTNASSNIKPEIKQRLMLRLFNEVAACIREEIVAEHDLIDAGLIYGSGFPPFLGGPVNYMNTQGSSKLQDQLSLLGDKHGVRFSPDHGWTELGIS